VEWKRQKFGEPWQQGESIISGIGQGYILTTPVQLATMVSRIANGGYEVNPTLKKVSSTEASEMKKMDLSQQNIELVKKGMFEVVNAQGGTALGARFNFNGQKMAGKTGTTQVRRISMKERQTGVLKQEDLPWKYRNHALFVGYAPHDNPKYGIAVLVEHGGSGSSAAAPIGGKMLMEALTLDATDKPVN
jgi:penicillin-binding protein 2